MKTLKYSKQRECIKQFLASRVDHPTADMVYISIREEFPNISLGTVYRNLNLLVELGEAIKIISKDGSDRFDAKTSPHYHFICSDCGSVQDIAMEPMQTIETQAKNKVAGTINSHEVIFYGVCNDCNENLS